MATYPFDIKPALVKHKHHDFLENGELQEFAVSCVSRLQSVIDSISTRLDSYNQSSISENIISQQRNARGVYSSTSSSSRSTLVSQSATSQHQFITSSDNSYSVFNRDRNSTTNNKILAIQTSIYESTDSSCSLAQAGDFAQALAAAKEALSKLKSLKMMHEKASINSSLGASSIYDNDSNIKSSTTSNIILSDINLMVYVNLAVQFKNNNLLKESFDTYMSISQNKTLVPLSNEKLSFFGVSLGNLSYLLGDYQKALKYFRLTYDKTSFRFSQNLRIKLRYNIATTIFKLNSLNGMKLTNESSLKDIDSNYFHLITDNVKTVERSDDNDQQANSTNKRRHTLSSSSSASNKQIKVPINANHNRFCLKAIVCRYLLRDMQAMIEILENFCFLDQSNHFRSCVKFSPFNDLLNLYLAKRQDDHIGDIVVASKLIFKLRTKLMKFAKLNYNNSDVGHRLTRFEQYMYTFQSPKCLSSESSISSSNKEHFMHLLTSLQIDFALIGLKRGNFKDSLKSLQVLTIPQWGDQKENGHQNVITSMSRSSFIVPTNYHDSNNEDVNDTVVDSEDANASNGNSSCLNNLANYHYSTGKFEKALKLYCLSTKNCSNLALQLNNILLCIRKLKQLGSKDTRINRISQMINSLIKLSKSSHDKSKLEFIYDLQLIK